MHPVNMQAKQSSVASQLYKRFQHTVAEGLIRRAQAGDMRAHTELYQLFSQAVFTLAHGICRNPQCAEDVLHNTFVKLISKVSTFRFQAPFGMWLRQMAVNESLMHLRKQKKHSLTLSSDEFDFFDSVAVSQVDPNAKAVHINEARHSDCLDLNAMLETLPDPIRLVLWLKEVEGYTHQEIGDLVGRTPSYSKSVIARAYSFLRGKVVQNVDSGAEVTIRG